MRKGGGALAVALGNRLAAFVEHAFGPKILDQENALLVVGPKHFGRGKAVLAQDVGDRHERIGVLSDMRDLWIGLAVEHRWPLRQSAASP